MDQYPNPEEEFELQYGDELQMLAEQEDQELLNVHVPGPSVRKSLNFTTPNSKPKSQLNKSTIDNPQPSTSRQADLLENSFDTDFQQLETNSDQNTRKRGVEELFGDIDDLLLEEAFFVTKKQKTEDEKLADNLALIERIVECRKLVRYNEAFNLSLIENYKRVSNVDHVKNNLSFRVPKYPFIGVTRHDGERIYVRMHSEEYEKEDIMRLEQTHSFTGIMGTTSKELWEDANKIINKQLDRENEEIVEVENVEVEETDNSKLWVDMYKPRKYTELLSDESTNRSLLKWMKLWDKVVFNRRPKIKPEIRSFPSKFGNNKNQKFFQKKELDVTLDAHDRPQNKVALLCGPPGLGKTTLAHMVARHAGYNVVEVNASDDRNVDSFKKALENATQMKSVIDREGRPNCLVFDEIDGAPAAAIDYLIKFVNGTLTTKSKKGKAQKASILKRPIICICNDVYVPALRPLRQIAFILNFPPTASSRLAERLKEICKHQRMKADTGAMMALSEKTSNDIRACLSVLHFFKTKNVPVTLSEVNKTSIGQKDVQKGLFTVWQEIFEIKRSKRGDDDIPLSTRMKNILNTVITFGDYERLAQGVFENFPQIKQSGGAFGPICTAAEWFSYTDCMSRKIHESQNYALNSYLPYGFVVWHFVFATYVRNKLTYPSVAAEVHSKTLKLNGIVAEILRGTPSHIRSYINADALRLDILPKFNEILVPNLRTINISLYAPQEKLQINNIVDIMIDYNLTYVQERNSEGNYVFYIDPNIDEVTTFQGLKVQRKTLSYTSKQMLSREIELEKVKRNQKGTNYRVTEEQTSGAATREKKNEEEKKKKANIENVVPNHLQRLKAKPVIKTNEIICKDFFGRVITKKVEPKWGDKGHSSDIWFQYKEGYNNAVKRKVTLKNIL